MYKPNRLIATTEMQRNDKPKTKHNQRHKLETKSICHQLKFHITKLRLSLRHHNRFKNSFK